jgi:hypothetical protein
LQSQINLPGDLEEEWCLCEFIVDESAISHFDRICVDLKSQMLYIMLFTYYIGLRTADCNVLNAYCATMHLNRACLSTMVPGVGIIYIIKLGYDDLARSIKSYKGTFDPFDRIM